MFQNKKQKAWDATQCEGTGFNSQYWKKGINPQEAHSLSSRRTNQPADSFLNVREMHDYQLVHQTLGQRGRSLIILGKCCHSHQHPLCQALEMVRDGKASNGLRSCEENSVHQETQKGCYPFQAKVWWVEPSSTGHTFLPHIALQMLLWILEGGAGKGQWVHTPLFCRRNSLGNISYSSYLSACSANNTVLGH